MVRVARPSRLVAISALSHSHDFKGGAVAGGHELGRQERTNQLEDMKECFSVSRPPPKTERGRSELSWVCSQLENRNVWLAENR